MEQYVRFFPNKPEYVCIHLYFELIQSDLHKFQLKDAWIYPNQPQPAKGYIIIKVGIERWLPHPPHILHVLEWIGVHHGHVGKNIANTKVVLKRSFKSKEVSQSWLEIFLIDKFVQEIDSFN